MNGKAPTNHASTATTYGLGNASNYGHVKLSDNYQSETGRAAAGLAASQAAVFWAWNNILTVNRSNGNWYNSFSNGLRWFYYEGGNTSTDNIPTPHCFVLVFRQNINRGIALAINWANPAWTIYVNRLHDDTNQQQWAGWKNVQVSS